MSEFVERILVKSKVDKNVSYILTPEYVKTMEIFPRLVVSVSVILDPITAGRIYGLDKSGAMIVEIDGIGDFEYLKVQPTQNFHITLDFVVSADLDAFG